MQSPAATVPEYLAALAPERRAIVDAIRAVILANLDSGYSEIMQYGMIGYAVPHSVFPAGYHCDPTQPLPFAGIASQKNYVSVYLMGMTWGDASEDMAWFRAAWAASGKKKLAMGKSCIRCTRLDDLALDVIGESIRRLPAQAYVARYQRALNT
jgi:hypothetical protein